MSWFYWGDSKAPLDAHERAHLKAAKKLGCTTRIWEDSDGRGRVETQLRFGKRGSREGAIIQMAGVLAGGGDAGSDYKSALALAKDAGMTEAEVRREARKCL